MSSNSNPIGDSAWRRMFEAMYEKCPEEQVRMATIPHGGIGMTYPCVTVEKAAQNAFAQGSSFQSMYDKMFKCPEGQERIVRTYYNGEHGDFESRDFSCEKVKSTAGNTFAQQAQQTKEK